jgi:hypothetical protein
MARVCYNSDRFTEVMEKRDGKWLYLVDHASAQPTGMQGAKQ